MALATKSTLLGLGMAAGLVFAAQAQTSGLASLPPNPTAAPPVAASPVGPSVALPGPNPGAAWNAPAPKNEAATVAPSPSYVGPNPGAGYYGTPPKFDKSADWESNAGMHPYTSSQGPRAH